jgi:hypothetical protein
MEGLVAYAAAHPLGRGPGRPSNKIPPAWDDMLIAHSFDKRAKELQASGSRKPRYDAVLEMFGWFAFKKRTFAQFKETMERRLREGRKSLKELRQRHPDGVRLTVPGVDPDDPSYPDLVVSKNGVQLEEPMEEVDWSYFPFASEDEYLLWKAEQEEEDEDEDGG